MTRIHVQKPSGRDGLLLAVVALPLVGGSSWLAASYFPENYLLVLVVSIVSLAASVVIANALIPKQRLILDDSSLRIEAKNQAVLVSLPRAGMRVEAARSEEGDASGRGGLFLITLSTSSHSLTLLGSLDKYNITTSDVVSKKPWRELYEQSSSAWQIPTPEELAELLVALGVAENPEWLSV